MKTVCFFCQTENDTERQNFCSKCGHELERRPGACGCPGCDPYVWPQKDLDAWQRRHHGAAAVDKKPVMIPCNFCGHGNDYLTMTHCGECGHELGVPRGYCQCERCKPRIWPEESEDEEYLPVNQR